MAESIFWVGRYVERAEGTARILDVSVYQALEQSDVEGSHAARRLLAVMGLPDDGARDPVAGDRAAGHRPESRSSIAGALAAARENTRAVRHVVPVEFWEHINATWAELPRAVGGRPAGRPRLVPLLRQDPVRRHDRPGRHDDEPRPDLALLHARPLPGADRRRGPPAGHGRPSTRSSTAASSCCCAPAAATSPTCVCPKVWSSRAASSTSCCATGSSPARPSRRSPWPRSAWTRSTPAARRTWDDARGLIGLARAELEYSAPATLARGARQRGSSGCRRSISAVSDAVTRRYFAQDTPDPVAQGRRGG